MDVSVIIPVYNVEKYLEECLDSVLNQSYQNLEVICINDGSSDRSGQILEEYASRDPRVKVIHTEQRGVGCARNTGLEHAQGKYVYFVDSDDMLTHNAIEIMYRRAEADNLDLLRVLSHNFTSSEAGRLINRVESVNQWQNWAKKKPYTGIYDGKEMMCMYMKAGGRAGGYRITVWSHFILRSLLMDHHIRFYPGIYYEDSSWAYEVYMKAQRTAIEYESIYLRRIREDSITMIKRTYEHYYGMFKGYCELVRIAKENNVPQDERFDLLLREVGRTQFTAAKIYLASSEAERSRVCEMNAEERLIFYSSIQRFAREFERSNRKIQKITEEKDELKKELARIKNSKAYRIGNALMYIPRKTKRLMFKIKKKLEV